MKKIIALSTVLALSVATVAEAKRGGGSRSMKVSRPATTQVAPQANNSSNTNVFGQRVEPTRNTQSAGFQSASQTKADATFNNTPNAQAQTAPAQGGNRLASFATGAAAGYILSEALTPTPAMANQATQTATPATQAVNSGANSATSTSQTVAEFKSIGGQIDPYLIEKTDGYRRYCLAGVQYLAPAQGQGSPTLMVNPNGTPLQCKLVP